MSVASRGGVQRVPARSPAGGPVTGRAFTRRSAIWSGIAAVMYAMPADARIIDGIVAFAEAAPIPKGRVVIELEAPQHAAIRTTLRSDGTARAIPFSIDGIDGLPSANAPRARLVGRLERNDGRLLARGTAPLREGGAGPVSIVLYAAMY